MLRALAVPALLSLLAGPALAQEDRITVTVRDTSGRAIPFALVQQANGASRAADDSGRVQLVIAAKDSLRFVVRRLGYEPFDGWAVRNEAGSYDVRLQPLAQSLKAARIVAYTNEMLERNKFYDRMERVRRGAYAAVFITPEELDLRNPSRISQMLAGQNSVKMKLERGRAMLLGRAGNCAIDVLLDGRRVDGLIQEAYTRKGQDEIYRRARELRSEEKAIHEFLMARQSIDELIIANSVVGIEIYANAASVPAELQQNMRGETCGLVVLWTGARR